MSKEYEIAGKGTYGIVIKPALPNKNGSRNVKFPGNVSKIYKNRFYFNEAIHTTKNIQSKIPELHINVAPYKKRYTVKNLPKNIKANVKKYLTESGEYDNYDSNRSNDDSNVNINDKKLYILRTPNLGLSIYEIENNLIHYRKLRQLPFRKICFEMYKCMNVVKAIQSAGYIHGDVRETNVLFNLDTMVMTIIDFDWLKQDQVFFSEYPTFFYCHPPECLFIFGRNYKKEEISPDNLVDGNNNLESSEYISQIYTDVKTHSDIYISEEAAKSVRKITEDIVKSRKITLGNITKSKLTKLKFKNILFNNTKKYIDSYGLGLTFYKFLRSAWYIHTDIHNNIELAELPKTLNVGGIDKTSNSEHQHFSKIRNFIFTELIPKMVHSNLFERWDIDTAITKFKYKLLEIGVDVFENEGPAISDELRRMELLARNYPHLNDDAPSPKEIPSENNIKNTFNNIIKNETKGGRRRTRKNKH